MDLHAVTTRPVTFTGARGTIASLPVGTPVVLSSVAFESTRPFVRVRVPGTLLTQDVSRESFRPE